MDEEQKLLAKLDWLTERAKRDYKGNPPPFEKGKTRQGVERALKKAEAKLGGDLRGFRPFWHGPPQLCEQAVPLRHLKGAEMSQFSRTPRPQGDTVRSCLVWDGAPPPPKPRRAYSQSHTACTDSFSISCMTPAERASAYRNIILQHPKVRPGSIAAHHDRWSRGTQLSGVLLTHSGAAVWQ